MESLSASDIHGYVSQRRRDGVQDTTIRREMSLVSAAISYANKWWDWSLPNPVLGRRPPRVKGRVRWLTREKAQRLIACAVSNKRAPYLASFIRLALHTGMRKGEMLGLEWRRVALTDGLVYLEPQHTKTNERRSVPLNQDARNALTALARFRATYCPNSSWVFCDKRGRRINNIRRSFATACRAAKIDDFHPHDLRHTCAAWLVSAGVPLPEVRDLLGHHTIQMTERYAHLAPDNVRAAVAVLETASHFGHSNEIAERERRCN